MTRHLTKQQLHYLRLMGITVWTERDSGTTASVESSSLNQGESDKPIISPPRPQGEGATQVSTPEEIEAWESLRKQVSTCTHCELHRGRTQTVFGVGDIQARWMLIGEAPGAEEDRQGEPFVGRAGKLLNAMLEAIGLERKQVMIANILKCRPPNNRDPRPEEVSACESYLKQQIAMVKPRVILALGRVAAQNLLKTDTPIGRMRGRVFEYPEPRTPVVVTYHPAYLLRSPREKRKSWQDLQLAMRIFEENS